MEYIDYKNNIDSPKKKKSREIINKFLVYDEGNIEIYQL